MSRGGTAPCWAQPSKNTQLRVWLSPATTGEHIRESMFNKGHNADIFFLNYEKQQCEQQAENRIGGGGASSAGAGFPLQPLERITPQKTDMP